MNKKLLQIPKFKTLEEEARFWEVHDSTDYKWDEIKDLKVAKKVRSIYKNILLVKLDNQILKAIEKIARTKGIDTPTAGKLLLRERLSELHAL